MVILDYAALIELTGVKLTPCPDCGGDSVVDIDTPPASHLPGPNWQPWEPDVKACGRCEGRGVLELQLCNGAECRTWFDPAEEGCAHGEPFCDDHRTECRECRLDARDGFGLDPWVGA